MLPVSMETIIGFMTQCPPLLPVSDPSGLSLAAPEKCLPPLLIESHRSTWRRSDPLRFAAVAAPPHHAWVQMRFIRREAVSEDKLEPLK